MVLVFWKFYGFLCRNTGFDYGITEGVIPEESFIAKLLATIYFGLTVLLILFNIRKIKNLQKNPQGLLILE